MSGPIDPAADLRSRLSAVRDRLGRLSATPPPGGLTDPDQPSGERWEWGQVWAHLAEFVPYWIRQVDVILRADAPGPVPFGRTKTDPARIAAIERDRGRPVPELWERMRGQLDELGARMEALTQEDWSKRGLHPTLGEMDIPRVFVEFEVGHLEQHADQLEALVTGPPS